MTAWKFTDVYAPDYQVPDDSILSALVFDVPEGISPVSGEKFAANLDLSASGKTTRVLAAILGMKSLPMEGTVMASGADLNIALKSSNDAQMQAGLARLPLIGGSVRSAELRVCARVRTAQAPADGAAASAMAADVFEIEIGIEVGGHKGGLLMQIPKVEGQFTIGGTFQQLGVHLSDLDFLVPGASFAQMFPADLPTAYYNPGRTALDLLSLALTFDVTSAPAFSLSPSRVVVALGISDIALYSNALYLNPLAVNISVSNPLDKPGVTSGLTGSICLYPYGKQTSPPSVAQDFTFAMAAQMPDSKSPTFSMTGSSANPQKLPVSTILCDLANNGSFDTGISERLVLEKFDFDAAVDSSSGTIDHFSVDMAMSAAGTGGLYFGLFGAELGVKDFSIAVSYVK